MAIRRKPGGAAKRKGKEMRRAAAELSFALCVWGVCSCLIGADLSAPSPVEKTVIALPHSRGLEGITGVRGYSSRDTFGRSDLSRQPRRLDFSVEVLAGWGSEGDDDGEFSGPADVAVDFLGNVYVADAGNHRIQKFDPSGRFLGKWGTFGEADGQFRYPYGIAVCSEIVRGEETLTGEGAVEDTSGQPEIMVYVADTQSHRVQKFDSSGNFLAKWGRPGKGKGELWYPNGMAVTGLGDVFICDWSHRIHKFDSSGKLLTSWAKKGSADGELWYPNGIAADLLGNIFVADTDNHRVQRFDSSGRFLGKWGSPGEGDGEMWFPNGIAVDASGKVYVADSGNHRIQVFTPSGDLVYKTGSFGSGDGEFRRPFGIGVNLSGDIYIADTFNHRVEKLRAIFRTATINWSGDRPVLEWRSTFGERYRVWASRDLLEWVDVSGILPSSGSGEGSWLDDGGHPLGPPSAARRRFYRIEFSP